MPQDALPAPSGASQPPIFLQKHCCTRAPPLPPRPCPSLCVLTASVVGPLAVPDPRPPTPDSRTYYAFLRTARARDFRSWGLLHPSSNSYASYAFWDTHARGPLTVRSVGRTCGAGFSLRRGVSFAPPPSSAALLRRACGRLGICLPPRNGGGQTEKRGERHAPRQVADPSAPLGTGLPHGRRPWPYQLSTFNSHLSPPAPAQRDRQGGGVGATKRGTHRRGRPSCKSLKAAKRARTN